MPDEAPGRELADVLSEEEFAGLWAPCGPLHVTQARQYHRLRAEHLQAQAVAAVDDKAERRRWQGAEEAALAAVGEFGGRESLTWQQSRRPMRTRQCRRSWCPSGT